VTVGCKRCASLAPNAGHEKGGAFSPALFLEMIALGD
jgi:hypothetical protein